MLKIDDVELNSLIETVRMQMVGTSQIVKADDWSDSIFLSERIETEGLHYTLTQRSLTFAVKIQKVAVQKGYSQAEEVKSLVSELASLGDLFRHRAEKYFLVKSREIETLIAEKGRAAKAKSKDGSPKSKLSFAENEIKFQSDLSTHVNNILNLSGSLTDLDNPDKVLIPTFNNTPIPLVMKDLAIDKFPAIAELLKRRNETSSSPDKSDI